MITEDKFKAGMHALGAAFSKAITTDLLKVYDPVLCGELSDETWESAVMAALKHERFFPPPAVLLAYGRPPAPPPTSLAGDAYLKILGKFEDGKRLGFKDVKELYGVAAAHAFVAAGGYRAFEWCEPESEPFRRKDFTQAYVEQVQADPRLALPAGPEVAALPEDFE